MTDDQKKQAESLSVANGGATITHDPATETLAVAPAAPAGATVISTLLKLPRVTPRVASDLLADFPPGLAEAAPTAEQGARAACPPKGLTGRAVATYVLTGDGIREQTKRARAARPPAPKKPTAPRTDEPAAKTAVAARRPRYPVEITDAVRLAKKARGTVNGAPGAKQHVITRKHIAAGMGAADVSVDEILKVSGARSIKALRAMADGTGSKSDLKEIGPLARAIPDPFCSGRNLASILVAWVDQIKAAGR